MENTIEEIEKTIYLPNRCEALQECSYTVFGRNKISGVKQAVYRRKTEKSFRSDHRTHVLPHYDHNLEEEEEEEKK